MFRALFLVTSVAIAGPIEITGRYQLNYQGPSELHQSVGDNDSTNSQFTNPQPLKNITDFQILQNDSLEFFGVRGAGDSTARTCRPLAFARGQFLCSPIQDRAEEDGAFSCPLENLERELVSIDRTGKIEYLRIETRRISTASTSKEACGKYKANLQAKLKKNPSSDAFYGKLLTAKALNLSAIPDEVMVVDHYGTTQLSTETTVPNDQLSETDWSGIYSLSYSGKSQGSVITGRDAAAKTVKGEEFDVNKFGGAEEFDLLLVVHDPRDNSMLVVGAGSTEARQCTAVLDASKKPVAFNCSPLFMAGEDEAGTECQIVHRTSEVLTRTALNKIRYDRVESRGFSEKTVPGCLLYRKKVADELLQGNAELFFKLLKESKAISDLKQLGDQFQIANKYEGKLAF